MKRRSLLTALAASAAFALSACGSDKAPTQQADAPAASTPASDRIDMVIFLDPEHCVNSQAMKPEVEAFLASPAASRANITVVDAASPEGYERMQSYRVNGVSFNVVPTIVMLRNNEIVSGTHGRMTAAQMTSLLDSVRSPQHVSATAFTSSDITARYRAAAPAPAARAAQP